MASTWRFSTLARLVKHACVEQKCRSFSVNSIRCGTVVPFKLSDIGEGIRDVIVKEWFVKPGDRVAQFDEICEVQSDKASVTITSRYDGLVKKLHYQVDDVALIGNALVDIELEDDDKESSDSGTSEEEIGNTAEKKEGASKNENTEDSKEDYFDKILATPAVRRIAMENNISLKDVIATGKAGRVLKEDILAFLEKQSKPTLKETAQVKQQSTGNLEYKTVPIKGYSRHMWKTMTQSLNIPHTVYSDETNVTKLLEYRNEVKEAVKKEGVSLTLMPFFIKAASRALEKVPQLNAWLDEENQALKVFDNHNIGVAMDTPDGLVVPNIKNVQSLSIVDIARELNRLQELGKKASIPMCDLAGTTFSLSNIGVIGGTYLKPLIVSPQIAIGGIGRMNRVPRFDENDNVVPAHIVAISWAADHRVLDGVTMAKYSNYWKYYVENPAYLLLGI